ncbi:MAG TPA: NADH-quinone oxidoreductase subunit A [Gemmatimonadales bacterium]|nr:NADH-quinone oxidoreductase subunit A [Gemmatimonadales bacterium]
MNQPYLAFLLLFAFVAFNAVLLIGLSHLLAPRKPTVLKDTPYESGMPPLGDAHERFSVKFYLVAMLFILFDIEAIFLYPWAVVFKELKMFAFFEMLVFIVILAVGYVYLWKRGALEWD